MIWGWWDLKQFFADLTASYNTDRWTSDINMNRIHKGSAPDMGWYFLSLPPALIQPPARLTSSLLRIFSTTPTWPILETSNPQLKLRGIQTMHDD